MRSCLMCLSVVACYNTKQVGQTRVFVVPAIDVLHGSVVRLVEGDYRQVTDYGGHGASGAVTGPARAPSCCTSSISKGRAPASPSRLSGALWPRLRCPFRWVAASGRRTWRSKRSPPGRSAGAGNGGCVGAGHGRLAPLGGRPRPGGGCARRAPRSCGRFGGGSTRGATWPMSSAPCPRWVWSGYCSPRSGGTAP